MAGYSGKSVVQKLGIKPGFCIFIGQAPRAYGDVVGELPGDVTIASRYVRGGQAAMPILRRTLSGALNWCFRRGLDVPIRDLSSGFRLYRGSDGR